MINNSLRRFLAVNCVVNGHSLLSAFDNDLALASEVLGLPEEEVSGLDAKLQELELKGSHFQDLLPELRAVINFYRTEDYSFVQFPGAAPVFFSQIAETDRQGGVDDELRLRITELAITSTANVKTEDEVCISDGVFYLRKSNAHKMSRFLFDGYAYYTLGPENGSPHIASNRAKFSLQTYKDIKPRIAVSILKWLASAKAAPTFYRDTVLHTCDFLPVYRATGAIMEMSEQSADTVTWLLPVEGRDAGKVVTMSLESVRRLLVVGLSDLENMQYSLSDGVVSV